MMKTILLLFLFLTVATSARAQLPYQETSLKKLAALTVAFQQPDSDAVRDGLDMNQIKVATELQLRKYKVPIASPRPGGESMPQLFIRADTSRMSTGQYVYSVSVEVMAVVDLDFGAAPKPHFAIVTIWRAGGLGAIGDSEVSKVLRSRVADLVDQFINDYLKVNPQK